MAKVCELLHVDGKQALSVLFSNGSGNRLKDISSRGCRSHRSTPQFPYCYPMEKERQATETGVWRQDLVATGPICQTHCDCAVPPDGIQSPNGSLFTGHVDQPGFEPGSMNWSHAYRSSIRPGLLTLAAENPYVPLYIPTLPGSLRLMNQNGLSPMTTNCYWLKQNIGVKGVELFCCQP
jgi:hypothetical protein